MDNQRRYQEFATLEFHGQRFASHGLDIDVLPELVAYKSLIVETAKDLWRQDNPIRQRLPRGFEQSASFKFFEIKGGSTVVPLLMETATPGGQSALPAEEQWSDTYFDRAVQLVEDAVSACEAAKPLPDNVPRSTVRLLAEFGSSLRPDESLSMRAPKRKTPVKFRPETRQWFAQWLGETYEDIAEVTGEIRSADLDSGNFTVRFADARKIGGKFSPEQEAAVIDGLKEHVVRRLSVSGVGEFSSQDGLLRRFVRVDSIQYADEAAGYDVAAPPIWEVVAALGERVPAEEWQKVPRDASTGIDSYLYGDGRPMA